MRILLCVLIVGMFLGSCAPRFQPPPGYIPPAIQILNDVGGTTNFEYAQAALAALRSRLAAYRGVFNLTEVPDDGEPLLISISIDAIDSMSRTAGDAKYGYYTIHIVNTTVTATIIDPTSGEISSSVTRQGSSQERDQYPSVVEAIQRGVGQAVDSIVVDYTSTW